MIFKIKILSRKTPSILKAGTLELLLILSRENESGIGKRIQIIAIKDKLKVLNLLLLRMKDYNFRLGSINCKFIGFQPHSQFLKLKVYKVSKFKNACIPFFKAVVSSAKRKFSRALLLNISFIKIKKSSGPKMDPWGKEIFKVVKKLDKTSLTRTFCLLSLS